MRTRLFIAFAVLGLVVAPAAALASHGDRGKSGHGTGQVNYELKGSLSGFVAVNGSTPGSITIKVTDGNGAGRAFKGDTLTFMLTSATRVDTNRNGTIANGDRGEVDVRGPAGLDAAGIQKQIPDRVRDEARHGDQHQNQTGDDGDGHAGHGNDGGGDD